MLGLENLGAVLEETREAMGDMLVKLDTIISLLKEISEKEAPRPSPPRVRQF
jgi:hypothetical protein